MIEDPLLVRNAAGRLRFIKRVIDIEANYPRLPLHGIQMEIVGKALALRKRVRSGQWIRAGISRSMQAPVDLAEFVPHVFHNVDFAARGPPRLANVTAQHPERRPNALSLWNPNPRLKAPVLLLKLFLGVDASRGVLARYAVRSCKAFLASRDHQMAFFNMRVLGPSRVILQLLIAEPIALDHKTPLRRIGR